MSEQLTDAEILSAFRDYTARQGAGPAKFVPLMNHPEHRGVIQANFIRPAPREYPRMMYHVSGMIKIVQDKHEQEALGTSWFITPQVRKSDWRARANQVFTKSGFQVYAHHVAFLQNAGVANVDSMETAALFLDKLDDAEQESFFREAEEFQAPQTVEVAEEKKAPAKSKK